MASNNEFLLKVVRDIETKLVELFNKINIKEQIEVVLSECGKTGLNSETKDILKYIEDLSLSVKGNEIFPGYESSTDPAAESTTAAEGAEEPAAEEPAAKDSETVRKIEELRRKIEEKEEERRVILNEPIPEVGSVADGSAPRPDLVKKRQEEKAKPIEKEIEKLREDMRILEGTNEGGGKKKRTYKKKKRTPMKKKRRSQKKRTPMKKKIK